MRTIKSGINRFGVFRHFYQASQATPVHSIAHSIVSDDNILLATHMKINSVSKVAKTSLIISLIKRYPNCHLTVMSPAMKRDRKESVAAMIQPGHIHSTCTDENGNIMNEGDASFSIDNLNKIEIQRSVPDSRLAGYQHELVSINQSQFTNTIEEIVKWEKISTIDSTYPLYMLAIPFKSAIDRDMYLMLVKANKELYKDKPYSLFTYYHKNTLEVMRANNCVTFNAKMNEDYFNDFIFLGDNPSPQLAYIKLMLTLFAERKSCIQQKIMDNILLDKEHFEADFHRFGVV